jgi:DNA helicase-2/ATP-dependent DNA helicase PcrA
MAASDKDITFYNEAFQDVLHNLNAKQQEAVNQIEGPVMVIAGPGTGKTHILSARIGKILLETDAQASNILCLTFTDAGVHAMRQRLLQFIGPEAHRVHLYTFHSFCNTVIQDNLERFGRQDMEPLSELERVEIIRSILEKLPLGHPLRLGRNDPFFYEKHLHRLFQKMKAERWSPAHIHECIKAYLESLPEREAFIYKVNRGHIRKGSPKTAKIEETAEKMKRLEAAVDLFPAYQQAMYDARRYDYEDMILWVLQAFQEHESLLRAYQEQYLYLLIDEYQDTNGAQNEIIRQLVAFWESPNLFIVGDDDQSIYEFQGARLKNLVDIFHAYENELKLVLLSDNYRSAQSILNTSAMLIKHNQLRVVNSLTAQGLDKVLIARNKTFADSPIKPQIIAYPSLLQEEVGLAKTLQELHQSGFPLEEVAVIYAQHKQVTGLVELLEGLKVPYNLKRKLNILHLPLVRNFRQLLEYFQLEYQQPHSGESVLFKMLHFTFFDLHPDDIAQMSLAQARIAWEGRQPWRVFIQQFINTAGQQLKAPEALERFIAFMEEMHRSFASISVAEFVERLFNRSGLLSYILQLPNKVWLVQAFNAFMEFVQLELSRNPSLSLADLLGTLKKMDSNRLPIEMNQSAYAEGGVNLITAHSSKGLEFQKVFILDCSSKYWEPSPRASSYQFAIPDTLSFSGEEDALEARRRLFYVAMTRAKESLHLSYSATNRAGKPAQPAIFIHEILGDETLTIENRTLPSDTLIELEALKLKEQIQPAIPQQDKATVTALLEGFQLSVSAMNRFMKCPLAFYYEHVLRAPVLASTAAHYGTAMHNALQRFFEKMKTHKSMAFPSAQQLLSLFEQEMAFRRGFIAEEDYQSRLKAGRRHLSGYYQQHIQDWKNNKKVLLEYKARNVEVEGAPIKGSIDKVVYLDGVYAEIIDYKTGSQSETKLKRPTPARPEGGSYWRQLVFYKLLFENYPPNNRIIKKAGISYLEPDTRGQFKDRMIEISAKDVSMVRKMIRKAYERIQAHDFYTGCGEPACSWCELVQNHVMRNSFADPEIEELDD